MNFKDFKFNKMQTNKGCWKAYKKTEKGYEISIVAGAGCYSEPADFLEDPYAYETYEFVIFGPSGALLNLSADKNLAAYQSKEQIIKLIDKYVG